MNPWLLSIAIAYLLGSIPFGYLLVRIFRKEDIRATGSGNIGATNVARSGAKGLGVATLVLDLLKGCAAVLIALHLGRGNYDLAVLAGVAAILMPVRYGASCADAVSAKTQVDGRKPAVNASPVPHALPIRKVRRVTLIDAAPCWLLLVW